MQRKRKSALKALDPAVVEWQQGAAENKAALSEKQKRDRKRVRLNMDVDAQLKAVIAEIASIEREDTSLSQAAAQWRISEEWRRCGRRSTRARSRRARHSSRGMYLYWRSGRGFWMIFSSTVMWAVR